MPSEEDPTTETPEAAGSPTPDVATHPDPDPDADGPGPADDADAQPLDLSVEIERPSACERHVVVTVGRADIDRYYDKVFDSMVDEAQVPGFRAGRAPKQLVRKRFKAEASEQVKSQLLMDSLTQISQESDFAAISEPDIHLDAVEVPDVGPMTFEFDIEVRPEFELPQWKGLKVERPVRDITDGDVTREVEQRLSRYGQLVPLDGPAADGDYVTLRVAVRSGGELVAEHNELMTRVRETLSFVDGQLTGFDALMVGAEAGAARQAKMALSRDAPNPALRGAEVELELEVLDVKRLRLPELTEDFLLEVGDHQSEADLRESVRENLVRQLEYEQQRRARKQITELLTESADWELPPGLLERQSAREVERAVMELRRSGFSEAEIRARENLLRQNSAQTTATALKEHFILERIAEDQNLDVEEGDYENEIFLMSMQSGESPRRVRAQLEKRGLMDVLRNQIIERKVLQLVQGEAEFQDTPYEPQRPSVEAINVAIGGGGESAIPDAISDQVADAPTAGGGDPRADGE